MSVVDSNISTSLVVADVSIRQDADGRYCLNDLHRAAGGDQKDKPVHFLKLDRTSDFIRELRVVGNPTSDKINDLEPVKVVIGRLDDDEKGITKVDTLGGSQDLLAINESGWCCAILCAWQAAPRRPATRLALST